AVRDLLTGTPIIPRMRRDAALVMPSGITESTYTKWMAGDATRLGYNRLPKAVEIIASRIADAEGPTFTYWYVPVVDTLAHALGVSAARVAAAAIEVDTAVAALTERLAAARGGLRIVATADHGHLDINPHLEVGAADPLLELLSAPPSGDTRTQFWHVDPERRPEFEAAFRHRFGDHFLLLETAEVEALRLLGPDTLSPDVRARLGDYMTLARAAATLRFEGYPGHEHYREMRSAHSGLTPAEMLVPLIVAGSGDPPDGMYR
ncbi:MAG: alkaline phosphatase family protein, partial [Dehalococcoidia bacterium]